MTPQIPNAAHHAQILGFKWIPQLMPVESLAIIGSPY
jgi:hypothetical protein